MRPALIAALALVLPACQDSPTTAGTRRNPMPNLDAAQTSTVNQDFVLGFTQWVPCANGGSGELVSISGPLHEVFHSTFNGNTVLISVLDNTQSLSGTGLTTGDRYHGMGTTRFVTTIALGGLLTTHTFVNSFRMAGQGSGNDVAVHETYHVTVNSNGVLTANVDNFSVTCLWVGP